MRQGEIMVCYANTFLQSNASFVRCQQLRYPSRQGSYAAITQVFLVFLKQIGGEGGGVRAEPGTSRLLSLFKPADSSTDVSVWPGRLQLTHAKEKKKKTADQRPEKFSAVQDAWGRHENTRTNPSLSDFICCLPTGTAAACLCVQTEQ